MEVLQCNNVDIRLRYDERLPMFKATFQRESPRRAAPQDHFHAQTTAHPLLLLGSRSVDSRVHPSLHSANPGDNPSAEAGVPKRSYCSQPNVSAGKIKSRSDGFTGPLLQPASGRASVKTIPLTPSAAPRRYIPGCSQTFPQYLLPLSQLGKVNAPNTALNYIFFTRLVLTAKCDRAENQQLTAPGRAI